MKGAYRQLEAELIDEDLGVRIMRTAQSSKWWYVQYNVAGRQKHRSLRTRNVKEARRLAKDQAAKLRLGQHDEQGSRLLRLDHAIEQYLKSLAVAGKDPRTIVHYETNLRQLKWYAAQRGVRHLARLNAELLETFQAELAEPGLPMPDKQGQVGSRKPRRNSPKTVLDKLKTVRFLINWCLRRKLIREDPAAGYRLPPRPHSRGVAYAPAEVQAICAAAEQPFRDMFQFLALTGLRISEMLWLTVRDVDLDKRLVWIRTKQIPETGEAWKVLKHGDERVIPLCVQALTIVQEALTRACGPWLFGTADGKRYDYPFLAKQLGQAKQKAGVTKQGKFHGFRHAFCSYLANAGVPPFQVMTLMGHTSLDIVLMYYHTSTDQLAGALESANLDGMVTAGVAGNAKEAKNTQGSPNQSPDVTPNAA